MKKTIKNLVCVSLAVLMLAGCGKIPQLKDGSELVIELDGLKMTTEEFYQKLKDSYGTNTLINSIKLSILSILPFLFCFWFFSFNSFLSYFFCWFYFFSCWSFFFYFFNCFCRFFCFWSLWNKFLN